MISSKHFFIGAAADVSGAGIEQYGLYEIITDRFVLTSKYPEVLQTIAILFSSRFTLLVCKLDTASNFSEKLIDNLCCTNWTMQDTNITVNRAIDDYAQPAIYDVQELIAARTPTNPNELIIKDIDYLMITYHWLTCNEGHTRRMNSQLFVKTEFMVSGYLTLPMPVSRTTAVLQELYKLTYEEFNLVDSRKRIEELIAEIA